MNLPDFLTQDEYGEIRVTGTRIPLYTIWCLHNDEKLSAEQIAQELPTLSLELIRKVIAFYLENREEVDAYAEEVQKELDRQAEEYDRSGRGDRIRQLGRMVREADERHEGDPEWERLNLVEKLRRLGVEIPTQGT
jgi:uncharacterized protein (DUF433 family)